MLGGYKEDLAGCRILQQEILEFMYNGRVGVNPVLGQEELQQGK